MEGFDVSGKFVDVWEYVWPEIWLALEQSETWPQLAEGSGYTVDELYMDVYVELVKALKKAPQPRDYDVIANDPVLARRTLESRQLPHCVARRRRLVSSRTHLTPFQKPEVQSLRKSFAN